MARQLNVADVIRDGLLDNLNCRFEIVTQTAAETFVLGANSAPVLFIDPTGANTLNMPPEADSAGKVMVIINMADAAEILTIRDDAGAALTPPITPTQNEMALMFCNGVVWRGAVVIGV